MAPRGRPVGLRLQRKSDLRRIKVMCDSRKSSWSKATVFAHLAVSRRQ